MRRRGSSGSVLALVPAGFLVLILLSAIAVDSAVAYLGQRQLHDALSAAANDAVTAGLNNGSFYQQGRLGLEPSTVGAVVCQALAAQGDSGLHQIQLSMAVAGDTVRLEGTATVDAVFGRAIPGFGRRSVRSFAEATAVTGPGRGPAVAGPFLGLLTPLHCV
jgi:hypothetical protein